MEGDRRAEAQPDERMSQTKVKSRMYASILPTERHPVAKRVIIAEAETDAPKPLRGAPDGTGYRDMARSESSAQELGRPADGKPTFRDKIEKWLEVPTRRHCQSSRVN